MAPPSLVTFTLALWAAAVSVPAYSQTAPASSYGMTTGNDVLAVCEQQDAGDGVVCIAWISGVTQGIEASGTVTKAHLVCFPKGSTNGQYRDVVVQYLRSHPEQRHWPSGGLAMIALADAFPCLPEHN